MTSPFASFSFNASGTNQVGRVLPDRLSEIRNVKDYGAKGDGVTDDWAAIMATLQWNRYTRTAASSNLTASFTGVVSSAAFNGTISGNNLTINGLIGTVAAGRLVWGQGFTTFQIASGSGTSFIISGPPQSVGPVAMQTNFGDVFSGTLSGNNLTVNSGAAGTVAIGQTLSGSGVTSCKIVSGSGPSWVVDGSSQSVTSDITTNIILTASSVTGTIHVNDFMINNGGTDASPSTFLSDTHITSQTSGTTGGAGVYVLVWPVPFQETTMQNFTSQAMMTVSPTVTLTSAALSNSNQFAFDVNNLTVAGNGISKSIALNSSPGIAITFQSMGGLVSAGNTIGIDQLEGRGIIYFPPGNYFVSQPVDFSASQLHVVWRGSLGASTITGNFNDYVFKQNQGSPVPTVIEKLNIVNTHATGGGIRIGGSLPGAVRSCTITAYRGINDYNDDILAHNSAYFGSFELAIEDCILNGPGGTTSGSIGITRQSDGPVTNCRIIGYDVGFQTAGGQSGQVLLGDYFEKCATAIVLNRGPDGGSYAAGNIIIAGCWLKNNSTAIYAERPSSSCTIIGILIEGATGQAPGGANPQYGILSGQFTSGFLVQSLMAGINVVGNYAVSGIYFNGSAGPNFGPAFLGVADNSSSPQPFFFDPTSAFYLPTQIACNARHIYTVAQLPASGMDASQELNVSDGTNGLGWGVQVTNTGTHTTPYLVQWNGSNWTVMGK